MQNIHALRRQAAARVRDGILPGRVPVRYYGSEGNGEECAICLLDIDPSEMMIEMPRTEVESTWMHVQCYRAYAQAVDTLSSTSPSGGSTDPED